MTGTTRTGPVRLEWTTDRADLVEIARAMVHLRRRGRSAAMLGGGALLLAGAGVLTRSPVGLVGALLVAFLLTPASTVLTVPLLRRRHPEVALRSTAEVDAEHGVRFAQADIASTFGWSAWSGLVETERLYLLRRAHQRVSVLVLAKRGTDEPQERERLRAVLEAHLGPPVAVHSRRRATRA
ncbi:hypothetical protein [Cellulomonas sp. NPDC058312]|uniref:hypothetical protein n=1 Tax=Cellulomonas sp. NPDC058312 TaxID=3346441 RepID=UPI0036E68EEC